MIEALNRVGLPAEFTQTGGMRAAIMVPLEAGYYLLLTDQEDTLSWYRDEHEGWFVGLYQPEERSQSGAYAVAGEMIDRPLIERTRPLLEGEGLNGAERNI